MIAPLAKFIDWHACRIGCTGASMKLPPSFAIPSLLNPRFAWTDRGVSIKCSVDSKCR